jgi:hypothetical protein
MILCLCDRRGRCAFSVCFRKSSAIRPDEGAPITRPQCWENMSWLWVKQFCLMITSCHIKGSCCVCGSVWWYFSMSVRILLVSFIGIFEDKLVMSGDASVKCGAIGVSCNLWSSSVLFRTLNVFGSGAVLFIFRLNTTNNLYTNTPNFCKRDLFPPPLLPTLTLCL